MIEGSIQGLADRELQAELRDLLCLAVVGDHLRWVLVGNETAELAEWLVDATAQWRGWADQLAKHLVSLGIPPDGRVRSLAEDTALNWVPDGWLSLDEARQLLADRLGTVVEWASYRRSQATDTDTRALLGTLCSGLETQASGMTLVNSARELEHRDATLAPEILRGSRR